MKCSTVTPRIINRLAAKHGVDLNAVGAQLRLSMSNDHQLVIERTTARQITVTHLVNQEGNWITRSEFEFFTGYGDPEHRGQALWIPIAMQGQRVAELNGDGTHIECAQVEAQATAADQANDWARSLFGENWLEYSIALS